MTAPLVVVSNRLPFRAEIHEGRVTLTRSPGGLVTALEPVLRERGGTWIGWSGLDAEDLEHAGPLAFPVETGVTYAPVRLADHEVSGYYAGFSNRTIWPLFHYFQGRTRIDAATWRIYERVNRRFAEAVVAAWRPGALVWVHDYQLLRVPQHVRERLPGAAIAFYLHIPFPAADIFRVLPWSRELLRGMLAADVVGFHVPSYADHFLTCAERLLGCDVDRAAGVAHVDGRDVSVVAVPVGVDAESIERLPPPPPPRRRAPRLAEILGVDRLDYTKGVHRRLLAVERLLERHPGHRGRIRFTQLLVPSRERVAEYRELKREIDETVGRVNGRFAEEGWSPIRYFVRSLPPEELVTLYRQADVALVTPLRDGMNLVAKEYVAARTDADGVLILSELAGAAEELQEAILVNPFDVDAVAEALDRAIEMPPDERQARMVALRDRVKSHTVHDWVRRFLAAAQAARERRPAAAPPTARVQRRLGRWLAERPATAAYFDYDGTLTPIVARPADATLGPAAREALDVAARTPNLDVGVVSGRALADLRRLVDVPGLVLVGNHGFEMEGPGVSFRHPSLARFQARIDRAAADVERLGIPGVVVEHKGATLSVHLRAVPEPEREAVADAVTERLRRRRLAVTPGNAVIEGRPPVEWHKGHAVLYLLVHRHGKNWPARVRALYVGDDRTDEDAFESLRGIGRSVRVGAAGAGAADFALPDPDAVVTLLRWLAAAGFRTADR